MLNLLVPMDVDLKNFLLDQYPRAYGKPLPLHIGLRVESTAAPVFEIRDGQPLIIQKAGLGVALFSHRGDGIVDIVDFERYINDLRTGRASEGKKCDFILVPRDDTRWIVLNEISETRLEYIHPFVKATTGQRQEGKLAHAISQLRESIGKLSCAPGFVGRYEHRVALFSYRIPQVSHEDQATQSMGSFLSVTQMMGNVSMPVELEMGFVFEQRIYPEPYVLT